jgi:hypothetical protein
MFNMAVTNPVLSDLKGEHRHSKTKYLSDYVVKVLTSPKDKSTCAMGIYTKN